MFSLYYYFSVLFFDDNMPHWSFLSMRIEWLLRPCNRRLRLPLDINVYWPSPLSWWNMRKLSWNSQVWKKKSLDTRSLVFVFFLERFFDGRLAVWYWWKVSQRPGTLFNLNGNSISIIYFFLLRHCMVAPLLQTMPLQTHESSKFNWLFKFI